MTDSHTHLTFPEIKINIEQILDEYIEYGGKHLLNVGHTPQTNIEVIDMAHNISEKYQEIIHSAIGIHPEYIQELISTEIEKYKQLSKIISSYVELVEKNIETLSAIGECGLDYYHLKQDQTMTPDTLLEIKEMQKHLFKSHVELAIKHNIPLTIHTRDIEGSHECIEDTLSIISDIGKGLAKGSFHSYTQSPSYIPEIIGLGFHIGVNGIVTYPKAQNVRDIVKNIPINKLLLETDAPLLPPQKIRSNKKNWRRYGAPADIVEIAETIATVKEMSLEEVITQTTINYKKLFLIN